MPTLSSAGIAIQAENLSKSYRVRRPDARYQYRTLQDEIRNLSLRVTRKVAGTNPTRTIEAFWALDDVSFEVRQGEVLGIIGRNGAGKSTLLRILSRITEPTRGYAEMHGRVGTLLEIGTGFHPELTGRENIYLSGAILGMRRREIRSRMDQIVEFAEIERFLETPVKQYSSGMYMRLAFSVAAHLDPEIMVVDEVLAVGDTGFQKKCLGKMGEVASGGRTVLFVSHNLAATRALCTRALLLDEGRLITAGDVDEVAATYEERFFARAPSTANGTVYSCPEDRRRLPYRIEKVEILDLESRPLARLRTWDTVRFRFWYSARDSVRDASLILYIHSPDGVPLIRSSTMPDGTVPLDLRPGLHFVDCLMTRFPLAAGRYLLGVGISRTYVDFLYLDTDAAILEVEPHDVYQSGLAPESSWSVVVPEYSWHEEKPIR